MRAAARSQAHAGNPTAWRVPWLRRRIAKLGFCLACREGNGWVAGEQGAERCSECERGRRLQELDSILRPKRDERAEWN